MNAPGFFVLGAGYLPGSRHALLMTGSKWPQPGSMSGHGDARFDPLPPDSKSQLNGHQPAPLPASRERGVTRVNSRGLGQVSLSSRPAKSLGMLACHLSLKRAGSAVSGPKLPSPRMRGEGIIGVRGGPRNCLD